VGMRHLRQKKHLYGSVVVSIFILWYLFHTIISPREVGHALSQIHHGYLLGTFCMLACANVFLARRWWLILETEGFRIPFKRTLRVFLANLPIAKITPGYTGDFFRIFFLRKEVPAHSHAGIIIFEALLDILILGALSAIGAILLRQSDYLGISVAIVMAVLFIIYIIPRVLTDVKLLLRYRKKIVATTQIFQRVLATPSKFTRVFVISIAISFFTQLYIFLLFRAFGSEVTLLDIIIRQPLVTVITLIPISFWGLGVRESAMLLLYSGLASEATIVSVGLLSTLLSSILFPLFCIPFTFRTILEGLHEKKSGENNLVTPP
jgi:uncharacterized protein (TIRG00374 family)